MARKDALLRLHQRLMEKRDALRQKFGTEDHVWQTNPQTGGDIGDAANSGASRELNTQLAALESRELRQVEVALQLIREGRYGKCEKCNHSIPIERLRAVPTSILCVSCQRDLEIMGGTNGDGDVDWGHALDFEGRMNPTEVSMKDIDVD